MAKVIDVKTKKVEEVVDGSSLVGPCTKMGVPFSCEDGYCGMCAIDIKKGEENLSELTESEENMGMDKKRRLACQCKIKKGTVEVSF